MFLVWQLVWQLYLWEMQYIEKYHIPLIMIEKVDTAQDNLSQQKL